MSAENEGNYTPADASDYLEGGLARYQSGGVWVINGVEVDMNKLSNPFDTPHPPPPRSATPDK